MTARRLLSGSWPAFVATLVCVALILHHVDVSFADTTVFGLYLLIAVAFPGVFCWRLLLGSLHRDPAERPTWFEDLALGSITGFGVQLPFYLAGVWIGVPRLYLVLPLAVLVLSLATRFGRGVWAMPAGRVDPRASWMLGAIVVFAVAWLARYVFPLHPAHIAAYKTANIDETFHQALISELLHRFPGQIPFLLGTPLDYHWFVHAQLAANMWATGFGSNLLLEALMPVAMVSLTVAGLGAVALRLTGRSIAAVVAPGLMVAGAYALMGPHYASGTFTEPFMSWRYVTSPSQSYGVMMAMPAIMLVLEVLRPRSEPVDRADRQPSRLVWVALTLTLIALAGSKATFMPIFLVAAVAVFGFRLVFDRVLDKTALLLLGIVVVVTIWAQYVLYGGTSGGLRVELLGTSRAALTSQHLRPTRLHELVMTVTLAFGWLLYGAGVVGLFKRRLWRDRRAIWMAVGAAAGIVVAFVLFRSGFSQMWFQRSVAPLVVLLSAWGVAELLPRPVPRRLGWSLAGLVAVTGLGAFVFSSLAEHGNAIVTRATWHEVLATALVPILLVALFFLLRLLFKDGSRVRPTPIVLVVVLVSLSLARVYSFGYDALTSRAEPHAGHGRMFAPGGVAAAHWIRDNSDRYDVVATNVHCAKPKAPVCDNRSFWVAAYTERRILIEGWGYTQITNEDYEGEGRNSKIPNPDPRRLAINDAAFRHPSPKTVSRLIDTYDVKFLFASKKYPVDVPGLDALPHLLTRTFANQNYVVFRVN